MCIKGAWSSIHFYVDLHRLFWTMPNGKNATLSSVSRYSWYRLKEGVNFPYGLEKETPTFWRFHHPPFCFSQPFHRKSKPYHNHDSEVVSNDTLQMATIFYDSCHFFILICIWLSNKDLKLNFNSKRSTKKNCCL